MNYIDLYHYIKQIDTLIKERQSNEAVAHCQFLLTQYPRHVETYKLLARAYHERQAYQQASDIFRRILSADPSDFEAHFALAQISKDEGNYAQGIWHVEHAFEIDSNHAPTAELRESLYILANIDPPNVKGMPLASVARLYVRGGIYDQAIDELTRLLNTAPDRYDWKVLFIEALWGSGKNVEAIKEAETIVEVLPNCIVARAVLGDIWLQNDRDEIAAQHLDILQDLVLIDKDHVSDYDMVSQVLLHASRVPERYKVQPLVSNGSSSFDTFSWKLPELSAAEDLAPDESFDWILDSSDDEEYVSLASETFSFDSELGEEIPRIGRVDQEVPFDLDDLDPNERTRPVPVSEEAAFAPQDAKSEDQNDVDELGEATPVLSDEESLSDLSLEQFTDIFGSEGDDESTFELDFDDLDVDSLQVTDDSFAFDEPDAFSEASLFAEEFSPEPPVDSLISDEDVPELSEPDPSLFSEDVPIGVAHDPLPSTEEPESEPVSADADPFSFDSGSADSDDLFDSLFEKQVEDPGEEPLAEAGFTNWLSELEDGEPSVGSIANEPTPVFSEEEAPTTSTTNWLNSLDFEEDAEDEAATSQAEDPGLDLLDESEIGFSDWVDQAQNATGEWEPPSLDLDKRFEHVEEESDEPIDEETFKFLTPEPDPMMDTLADTPVPTQNRDESTGFTGWLMDEDGESGEKDGDIFDTMADPLPDLGDEAGLRDEINAFIDTNLDSKESIDGDFVPQGGQDSRLDAGSFSENDFADSGSTDSGFTDWLSEMQDPPAGDTADASPFEFSDDSDLSEFEFQEDPSLPDFEFDKVEPVSADDSNPIEEGITGWLSELASDEEGDEFSFTETDLSAEAAVSSGSDDDLDSFFDRPDSSQFEAIGEDVYGDIDDSALPSLEQVELGPWDGPDEDVGPFESIFESSDEPGEFETGDFDTLSQPLSEGRLPDEEVSEPSLTNWLDDLVGDDVGAGAVDAGTIFSEESEPADIESIFSLEADPDPSFDLSTEEDQPQVEADFSMSEPELEPETLVDEPNEMTFSHDEPQVEAEETLSATDFLDDLTPGLDLNDIGLDLDTTPEESGSGDILGTGDLTWLNLLGEDPETDGLLEDEPALDLSFDDILNEEIEETTAGQDEFPPFEEIEAVPDDANLSFEPDDLPEADPLPARGGDTRELIDPYPDDEWAIIDNSLLDEQAEIESESSSNLEFTLEKDSPLFDDLINEISSDSGGSTGELPDWLTSSTEQSTLGFSTLQQESRAEEEKTDLGDPPVLPDPELAELTAGIDDALDAISSEENPLIESVDVSADSDPQEIALESLPVPDPLESSTLRIDTDSITKEFLNTETESNIMANTPENRPEPPQSDDLQDTLNWLEELALYDTEGILRVPRTGNTDPSVGLDADPVNESDEILDSLSLDVDDDSEDAVLNWLDDVDASDFEPDIPQQIEESPTVSWEEENRASAFRPAMPTEQPQADEIDLSLFESSLELDDSPVDDAGFSGEEEDALFNDLLDSGIDEDFSSTSLFDESQPPAGTPVVEEESDSLLAWINSDPDLVDDEPDLELEASDERLMGLDELLTQSEAEQLIEAEVEAAPVSPVEDIKEIEEIVEEVAEPPKPAEKKPAPSLFGAEEEFHVSEEEIAYAAEHGESVTGFDIPDDPDSLMAWLNIDMDDLADSDDSGEKAEESLEELIESVELSDEISEDALADTSPALEIPSDLGETTEETLSGLVELPEDPDEALRIIEGLSQETDESAELDAFESADLDALFQETDEAVKNEALSQADEALAATDDIFADSPVETTGQPFEGMASEYLFGDLNKDDATELDWLDEMTFDSDPALLGEIHSPTNQAVPKTEAGEEVVDSTIDVPEDDDLSSILNWDETLEDIDGLGGDDLADLLALDSDDPALTGIESVENAEIEDEDIDQVLAELTAPSETETNMEEMASLEDEAPVDPVVEPAESTASAFALVSEEDAESLEDWLKSDTAGGLDWLDDNGSMDSSMNWLTQEEQASQINPLRRLDTAMLDDSVLNGEPVKPQAEAESTIKEEEERPAPSLRPQYQTTPPDEQLKEVESLPSRIAPRAKLDAVPKMLTSQLNNYRLQIKQGENLGGLIKELETSTSKNNDPRLFQILGDAYMKAGELQSALDAYRKAQRMLQ